MKMRPERIRGLLCAMLCCALGVIAGDFSCSTSSADGGVFWRGQLLLEPLRYSTLELPLMDLQEATLLNDGRRLPLTQQPLLYVKGLFDTPVSRIREIPVNSYPNEVMVLELKGNFKIEKELTRLSKSASWFYTQASGEKE